MNKKQKLAWKIIIPIIFFFIALWVVTSNNLNPFDLKKTWGIWLLYLLVYRAVVDDIFGTPESIYLWVRDIFLYSLALPLFFLGIALLAEILNEYKLGGIYDWFMDFSLGIKIPVCVIVAVFIRQYLKKAKEDKDRNDIELQNKMLYKFFSQRELIERLFVIVDWLSYIRLNDKFTPEQKEQLQKAYEITWEVHKQIRLGSD
jgi:hypothetical protein